MAELVAKRYAQALFELAVEKDRLDGLMSEAEAFLPALSDDVLKLLLHPGATPSDKTAVIEALRGQIDDDILGMCVLVIRKGREEYLCEILDSFIRMSRAHLGLTIAHVRSAVPLSDAQLADIAAKLQKQLNKKVSIHAEIDPALIAGLYVKVEGRVFDGTVKTELADIRRQLLNVRM